MEEENKTDDHPENAEPESDLGGGDSVTDQQDSEEFRVLIGVDQSHHSEDAFRFYLENVHVETNRVIVMHVMDVPGTPTRYMSADVFEEALSRERHLSKDVEKTYTTMLQANRINGKFLSLFGNKPAELIVETAHKEKVDMVVIGSRGSGKLRRTILGSISDYVLHHAHCAVTICRKEHHHHGLLHKFIKPRSRTSSTCSTSSNP